LAGAVYISVASSAFAARPLLDQHQWDSYFGLYARDYSVPWKKTTVRLDTYSGAPVDFAAYNVDPADIIVAGQNRAPRALDTARRRPVARWRFSPPPGYRFESNDVAVPLGSQEGFYVVVARRGDAEQQVWLNRTHVGLVVRQSAGGLVLWAVDLRRGRPLGGIAVDFLVGLRLVRYRTGPDGLIAWHGSVLPTFALAQSGPGRAFVSILPQPPAPRAVVGVRLDSAAARAGSRFRFVGFARARRSGTYRRATGSVRVSLLGRGKTLGTVALPLDAAGSFAGELAVPSGLDAGEYAVLASARGTTGGTSLHVDAASDIALTIAPSCPCDPDRDVPLGIVARRGDAAAAATPLHVQIVRSPHVAPPGAVDAGTSWGATVVYDRTLTTSESGRADVLLPSPSDGLDSTYGVRVTARGATATSRIVVPNASLALALLPLAPSVDTGEPVAFELRGFDPTAGTPIPNVAVRVQLSHGASAQAQTVSLDARGRAKVVFRRGTLGSNLALAFATVDGRRALDAASVLVEPSALAGRSLSADAGVSVSTDRPAYVPGDRIGARAEAPGAAGDALLALTAAATAPAVLAPVGHGTATATLKLGDPKGAAVVEAAFVRDGAIALGSTSVRIDGPGRALATSLALDRTAYAPGDTLHATLREGAGRGGATVAVRIADGPESGPAYFEDASAILAPGETSTQVSASDDPQWHAYVAPARSKASDIFAAERPRKVGSDLPSVGVAAPRTLYWQVARAGPGPLDVPVPGYAGHFVVSVLRMADDGDVGAASASFEVR